jgi:hypothetical protein
VTDFFNNISLGDVIKNIPELTLHNSVEYYGSLALESLLFEQENSVKLGSKE